MKIEQIEKEAAPLTLSEVAKAFHEKAEVEDYNGNADKGLTIHVRAWGAFTRRDVWREAEKMVRDAMEHDEKYG